MTKTILVRAVLLLSAVALPACAPVVTKTALVTPSIGEIRSAGPGDVVMDFRSRRSLPNIAGKADLFGRTTDAGRTTVRYLGSQGQQAIFERSDVAIQSDATTMSETPLFIPQTSNTTINGTLGTVPVSGSASSTSYQFIGPRPSSEYATATRPIQINLVRNQNVRIEGRTLTVISVSPMSVDYRIN